MFPAIIASIDRGIVIKIFAHSYSMNNALIIHELGERLIN